MIIDSIRKFFRESLYRARIANSQDLEYDNKLNEALNLLNSYEYIANDTYEEHLEYFLIRSRLKNKLKDFEGALEDAILVKSYINDAHKVYNEADLAYLKKYLYFLLQRIYQDLESTKWKEFYEKFKAIEINDYDKLNELYLQWLPLPNN